MNEWRGEKGIWSLVSPAGVTLIQIMNDGHEYRVAQHGGVSLGRDFMKAKKTAEKIAEKLAVKEK